MDRKLEAYLPERGIFFEAGANDGYTWSNTYYLERIAGWRGVLVEAIPSLSEECRRLRRYSTVHNCALVPGDFEATHVTMKYSDLRSLIKGSEPRLEAEADEDPLVRTYDIEVPVRTINDVLMASRVSTLDFVSLDLEGFEAPALRGFDLDRYEPTWMLIEVSGGEGRHGVEQIIGEGYAAIAEFGASDVLYRRR
jgi:FkbM family methyltransferase